MCISVCVFFFLFLHHIICDTFLHLKRSGLYYTIIYRAMVCQQHADGIGFPSIIVRFHLSIMLAAVV